MDKSKNGWADKIRQKRGTCQEEEIPNLPVYSYFIWDAFSELSTTRNELGPIPWTAINEYAYRYRILDMNEFNSFEYFIRKIDDEYRTIRNNELQAQRAMKR